jgi:hypothetical protein
MIFYRMRWLKKRLVMLPACLHQHNGSAAQTPAQR